MACAITGFKEPIMATFAVNILFGADMQNQLVLVEAANRMQAEHLSLSQVDHDGMWDFLDVECVKGEPDCEAHVVDAHRHFRNTFIGPAEDILF